jgi:hypothetical protein
MKKVIELLEKASDEILLTSEYMPMSDIERLEKCSKFINEALERLQAASRWETPEQYKKRTGETWPDEAAVYIFCTVFENNWSKCSYRLAKATGDICVCATEAGPTPANWKPEGDGK